MPATRGNGYYTSLATCLVRNKSDIWLCVGQAEDWPGGVTPPENSALVPNPVIYKKVSTAVLVKTVTANDDYDYVWESYSEGNGVVTRYFKTITETEAADANNRIFLLKGHLVGGDGGLEEIVYRSVGFYQGLKPATGHESATVLTPNHVTDPGNLMVVQNYEGATIVSGESTASPQIAIQVGG